MSHRLLPLLGMLAAGVASAQPAAATFDRAFDAYRRVEVLVPPEFRATCQARGPVLRCALSDVPEGFYRSIVALEGGVVADVRLVGNDKRGLVLEFERRGPEVVVLQARLDGPPRWVVEAGEAELMGTAVEDEHPFRPFPLPAPAVEAPLPTARLEPLPEGSVEHDAFNECFRAWRRQDAAAGGLCAQVESRFPGTAAAARARVVRGEIVAERSVAGEGVSVEELTAALEAAEAAAPTPLDRVRYPLLAARALGLRRLPERAEMFLEGRAGTYAGTAGQAYLDVARASMKLQLGDRDGARQLLDALRQRPGDTPGVGQAFAALAALSYEERAWTDALGLYEVLRTRWPELLAGTPDALLRTAELYFLHSRLGEARTLYEDVRMRFPEAPVEWLARVRLAMLRSHTDPEGAREDLKGLAETLRASEGRNLARVMYARMSDRPERVKTLFLMRREMVDDHARVEMLLDLGRESLYEGRLREAFDRLRELWRLSPEDLVLRRAPLLFDRVLQMLARAYLENDRSRRLLSLYYGDRRRFEVHRRPDQVHLLVARAMRRLGLSEEAMTVLQRGLRGPAERAHPQDAARVYLEMAGVLREAGDAFRLKQILEYIERSHAGRFDDFEFWMAKGTSALWQGRFEEARDVLRFALNGPATPAQRVELAERIADVYEALGDPAKAARAVEAQLALQAEAGDPPGAPRARDARWRLAELHDLAGQWPEAVAASTTFLEHHPLDPARLEAMYLRGRALRGMGDTHGAARAWDRVLHEDPKGPFGRLAKRELEAMRWRLLEAPAVVGAALPPSSR